MLAKDELLSRIQLMKLCKEQSDLKVAWSTMGDALKRLMYYGLIRKRKITNGCSVKADIVYQWIKDYRLVFGDH